MPRKKALEFLHHHGPGRTVATREAGDTIFRQGDPAKHVFYLVEGRAKEVMTVEGRDTVISIIEREEFFGVSSMDGLRIRFSTVTALVQCTVTSLTTQAMTLALNDPEFSKVFMNYLIEEKSKGETDKVDLIINSSERRLAQRLLILAQVSSGTPIAIGPEITQEMLAEMIGTSRSRVNLFLNRFRNLGWIKYAKFDRTISVQPSLLAAILGDTFKSLEP